MITLLKRFIAWITSFFSHSPIDARSFEKYRKIGGEPDKKALKREAKPRVPKQCLYRSCEVGTPMMVSEGQIAYTHKECRTNYRSLRFRS